jgi:hypothetical protein
MVARLTRLRAIGRLGFDDHILDDAKILRLDVLIFFPNTVCHNSKDGHTDETSYKKSN